MEKTQKEIFSLGIILLFVCSLFGPYVSINGVQYNAINILFADFSSVYTYILWLPFIIFLASIILQFLDKNKYIDYALFILFLITAVLFFFTPTFTANLYGISEKEVSIGAFILITALILVVLTLYYSQFIFINNQFTISDIVEIAMLVALSIILDLPVFKIRIAANGGSISFAMLPIFIIALRKGFIRGFISGGVIYGLLDCIIDGYGFVTYPLDYLLGFGLLAVIGLFRKWIFNKEKKVTFKGILFIIIGIALGCICRTFASTLSGMFIYEMDFISSLIYQLIYIGPSAAIVLVGMIVLYKPLLNINAKYPSGGSHKSVSKEESVETP
ncbi:MAG: energy-coupled thiamine transporter ThiT [Coprobacillus sp.]|nr:energy-coupled thiamine transporter ThiT [Coprobacillus sp.]